jgi:hypothetical protein
MARRVAIATVASTVGAIVVQLPLFLSYTALPALFSGASFGELAGPMMFIAFWVSLVSAVVVIVIGLPAFAVLHRKNLASVRNVGLTGAVIACVGALIVGWPARGGGSSYSATTRFGYRDLIVDGAPTFWGWLEYGMDVATFGIHGLVGALVFVYVWRSLVGGRGAP